MKMDRFRTMELPASGRVALLVLFVFLGGIAWEQMLSDSNRDPSLRGAETERMGEQKGMELPVTLYPDYAPLSALIVGTDHMMNLEEHRQLVVDIVRAVNGETPILLLVSGAKERVEYEQALAEAGLHEAEVHLLHYPRDSIWVRDYGPLFANLPDGSIGVMDASYSAVFPVERWRDDECPILLSNRLNLPLVPMPLRLQGGNVVSINRDVLITTNSVLSDNASRGFGVRGIMSEFRKHMGLQHWFCVEPMEGEHTKHADMFVSALSATHVLVAEAAQGSINAERLDHTASLMAQEAGLKVSRIPLPPNPDKCFRSYNNLVVVNEVVLVPVFSDVDLAIEQEALDQIRRAVPEKRVVGVNADALLEYHGFLRCMTVGVPAGVDWKLLFKIETLH